MDNDISGNNALFGGGIACWNSCTPIMNNRILSNTAEWGAGIYIGYSVQTLSNNLVFANSATEYGGGLYSGNSDLDITNNVFTENSADLGGGGIYSEYPFEIPVVSNAILWNNSAPLGPELYLGDGLWPTTLTIEYSDVDGGQASAYLQPDCTLIWGEGMIDADPLFVNAPNHDFHLKFQSPCRDMGNNEAPGLYDFDFEGDPRISQGHVDIGADEFHPHLYCTGSFAPHSELEGKVIGLPGTSPVGLFIGSGIMDPPLLHKWGEFHLESPWLLFPLIPIPTDGVLVIPTMLPSTPAPYDVPMQALIGLELSNPFVMEIR